MNERIGVNYWSVDKSTLETFYSIRKDNIEGGVEAILYGLLEMLLPSLKEFCKMPKVVDNILVVSTKDTEEALDKSVQCRTLGIHRLVVLRFREAKRSL